MNILATVSLVLCLCACVFWMRSYWHWDAVRYRVPSGGHWPLHTRTVLVCSDKGRLELGVGKFQIYLGEAADYPRGWDYKVDGNASPPSTNRLNAGWRHELFGFGLMHDWESAGFNPPSQVVFGHSISAAQIESFRAVWMPYWFLAWIFALLPARRTYVGLRRRRRLARGLCLRCGYDMRESGQRCPECGATKGGKIVHEVHQGHEGER